MVIRQLPDGQADTQLLDALSNRSISTILLASDYEVGSQFDQFSGPWQVCARAACVAPVVRLRLRAPLLAHLNHKCWHAVHHEACRLCLFLFWLSPSPPPSLLTPWQDGVPMLPVQRNITIASVPGLQPQPMLDLSYKLSVLNLCDTCWVTLANITVKDERMVGGVCVQEEAMAAVYLALCARFVDCATHLQLSLSANNFAGETNTPHTQGANAQFDFFLGEGNSVVWAINVVRNRRSCTDPGTAVKLVGITKRSPRFLGPNGSPNQTFALEDFEWRGSTFPRTLHLVNYSAEFPRHYNGGYSVVSVGRGDMSSAAVDANVMSCTGKFPVLTLCCICRLYLLAVCALCYFVTCACVLFVW